MIADTTVPPLAKRDETPDCGQDAPVVSVIIPAYNARASIARAIDSVLSQTFDALEILVIDDASNDGTAALVEAAYGGETGLRLTRLDRNRGPAHARNVGLAQARGRWIALLDADDAWGPERLQRLLACAADADAVFDNLAGRDPGTGEDTGPLFPAFPQGALSVASLLAPNVDGSRYNFGYLKPIMRRAFLVANDVGYDESLRTSEDLLLYLTLLLKGARTSVVDAPLYVYTLPVARATGDASVHSHTVPRDDEVRHALERMRERYAERLSEEAARAIDQRIAFLRRIRPVAEFYHARQRRDYRRMAALLLTERAVQSELAAKIRQRVSPRGWHKVQGASPAGAGGGGRQQCRIMVDRTHMGRRASGIERVTRELFSAEALAPLQVEGIEAPGRRSAMILHQMLLNPIAGLAERKTVWLFPGYPPSPVFACMRERSVLYVHDLFLMTRRRDLNSSARFYMSWPFRVAVTRLRYFLVNSATTGVQLSTHVGDDARILHYRPRVPNAFNLAVSQKCSGPSSGPLIVGALGTVEPRKNFLAAAEICRALSGILARPVELHIVGRQGWGDDFQTLSQHAHVRLHGFLSDAAARAVVQRFDLFLCTSHDEGLGLPLLETQYAGLPVVAPDRAVFREVLGASGVYIDSDATASAARRIAALLEHSDWRARAAAQAQANIARWNAQADEDRRNVVAFLKDLSERVAASA